MKALYSFARYLRKNLDLQYPFYIRRENMGDFYGGCDFKKDHFLIRVDSSLDESHSIQILIHEVAHCLSYFDTVKECHGTQFGKSYSKVYKLFLKWNEEE